MEPTSSQVAKLITAARDRLTRLPGPELERTKWLEQNLQRDVQVIASKLEVWQDTWLNPERHPNVSLEVLWGFEGWTKVRASLGRIEDKSKMLESFMSILKTAVNKLPREKWKKALRHVRLKRQTDALMMEIRKLLDDVNLVIDELWIYSETTFDTLHDESAQNTPVSGQTAFLESALHARSGSLQLYKLCCRLPSDYSLDVDLVSLRLGYTYYDRDDANISSFYRLFTQPSDDSKQLTRYEVENIPDSKSISELKDSGDPEAQDFESFLVENHMIPTDRFTAGQSSALRINKTASRQVRLKTIPESLEQVLESLKERRTFTRPEHMTIGAKINLAFKLVEAGLFLLGTPWFSSLNSHNILRLEDTRSTRHTFILKIQATDLNDLVSEDADALAETAQLSRLGTLLAEIALNNTFSSSSAIDSESDSDHLEQLPLVEQAMGAQYCKATAFCLQPRQRKLRFQGPGKYAQAQLKGWKAYLEDILKCYYSQVYLRLEELRQIDSKSEYRSRKSEEMEQDDSGRST